MYSTKDCRLVRSAIVFGILLSSVAAFAQTPQGVVSAPTASKPVVPALPPPQPRTSSKDGHYLLQKGDQLAIKVMDVPDLNSDVTVGPDGRIAVMMLGEIEAAGQTVEDVRKRIYDRYAQEYKEPQVALTVKSFGGLRAFVGGEVERPGMIPLNGDLSALSAIFQSGGFKASAKTDNVILIRNDGTDKPVAMKINLKRVWKNGGADVALQPFDIIYVPMSKIASLDKIVDEYIRRVIPTTLNGGFQYIMGNASSSVIRFQ